MTVSLFSYIRELQEKPDHVRRRILWITTVVLALVIGGAWATTLPSRLSLSPDGRVVDGRAPISSLQENMAHFFEETDGLFGSSDIPPSGTEEALPAE